MSDLQQPQAQTPPMPEGLQEIRALQQGGFSDQEIQQHIDEKRQVFTQAGFSQREQDDYFGIKPFDEAPMQQHFESALTNMVDGWKKVKPLASTSDGAPLAAEPTEDLPAQEGPMSKEPAPQEPPSTLDAMEQAFHAGLQMSVSGLAIRGKLPDIKTSEDADWYLRIANQVGMTLGDLPPALAAGISASLAAGPGAPVAAPITTAIAIGAAGNALPAAMREFYIQKYQKGEVTDFKDFWTRSSAIFLKTLKAAAVGGATLGAGKAAGIATAAATPLLRTSAQLASEIGTMVTLGKGLEGQVPHPRDFADAAIVIAGLAGVQKAVGPRGVPVISEFEADNVRGMSVEKKLGDIYSKTGISPHDVALQAEKDPVLMQQLVQKSVDIPEAYKPFIDPAAQKTTESVKLDPSFDEGSIVTEKPKAPLENLDQNSPNSGSLDTTKDIVRKLTAGEEGSIGLGQKPEPPPELSESQKTVLSRIGEAPEKGAEFDFEKAYTKAVDRRNPLKVWEDVVTKGEKMPAGADPYIISRLMPGNTGRAEHAIRFGVPDFKNPLKPVENPGLKQILEPLGNRLQEYRAYALAKAAVSRAGRGVETGIDLEAAKKTIAETKPDVIEASDKIVQYRRQLLNYMRDSGILSEDQIATWEKTDPDYTAPLYRILEDRAGGSSAGKGMTVKNPIKRAKGSDLQIVDPIESHIKDTFTFIEMAERNRLMRSVVDAGRKYSAPSELLEKVETPIKAIDVSPEELQKFQDDMGIDGDVAGQAMTIFRGLKTELKPDEFQAFYDGKPQRYRVPIEVAEALKDMDAPSASMFIKLIATPVRLLKAGTTMLPEFMIKNTFRDQLTRFVFSKENQAPYMGFFDAVGEQTKEGESYKAWLRSGGASSSFMSINRDYIETNIMRLKPMESVRDKVWNAISSPKGVAQMFGELYHTGLNMVEAYGELAENATRIAEFKANTEGQPVKRSTAFEAAYNSREVTLDFQRIGASMQAANQAIQFLNAQVQGIDRVVREAKENPMSMIVKGGVLTTISVMLWAANHNDPYVQELPQWQKDMFWTVHIPHWVDISPKEAQMLGRFARQGSDGTWQKNVGPIFRLPKPQELGLLFATTVERLLDGFVNHDPKAASGLAQTTLGLVTPPVIPASVGPLLETFNNKSMFTEAPIVPGHLEKLLPEAQYTEYTSESAKLLGKIIPDVKFGSNYLSSPMVIENWIRGWSGGGGMYALQIADAALGKLGIATPPPKPDSQLADMPIIKAFVARFPTANMRSITDFREKYQQSQEYLATIKSYADRGDAQAAQKLLVAQENRSKLVSLASTQKALDNTKRLIEMIAVNPKTPPDQKRQLIDGLYMSMANFAWYGNKMVSELEEKLNKK